jgi:NAD+ synthase
MTAEKKPSHFKDPDVVATLIARIRARHGCSMEALADRIAAQMRAYFEREFRVSLAPSRFTRAGDASVRARFLFGLSGGIDSSVVAALAVRAVGAAAVLPVTMPAHPGDESVAMAALVRESLKLNEPGLPYVVDIGPIVDAYLAQANASGCAQMSLGVDQATQSREQRMRAGNFGSRARIGVLYDLQRAIRGRVLGTGNRSEFCQGYSTKFGTPISYDFGVLDELYKTDIYALADVLGLPEPVRTAAPSTGYFPGQTHEGELGANLDEQDVFAFLLFEEERSVDDVVAAFGADRAFATLMHQRFTVSLHKRALNAPQERVRLNDKILPGLLAPMVNA